MSTSAPAELSSETIAANRAVTRDALAAFLRPEVDYAELTRAIESLGELLGRVTGFNGRNEGNQWGGRTETTAGTALSPDQAAACLREHLRTKRYLQAVDAGLRRMAREFPGERIEVLYAGCGPYALLLLPFATREPADAVRVTLLDIHQESLDAVARVARALGIEPDDFFGDFIQCDAAAWRPPDGSPFHMLVTETMNLALTKEPQVAITANLAPALKNGGVLVPEEVLVEALLLAPSGAEHELGEVVRLNARTAAAVARGTELKTNLPANAAAGELRLRTTIQTSSEFRLSPRDCSLTLPLRVGYIDGVPGDPLRVRFLPEAGPSYEIKPAPRERRSGKKRAMKTNPSLNDFPAYRRLRPRFDVERLREDLAAVPSDAWLSHYQKRDYEGGWNVAALRSLAGRADMIYASPEGALTYADTELLRSSPAFLDVVHEIEREFACEAKSTRLLRLDAGARIHPHADDDLSVRGSSLRLHVPIITSPLVDFRVAGDRVEMRPGECWYCDFTLPHSVANSGDEARVHLIIDCAVGAGLRRALQED